MNNATQLKAFIKNMVAKTGVNANSLLQNYMLERLLERISLSKYSRKFILKGGMLVSAMVGLDSRTTMDMDALIKGIDMSKETIITVFDEILSTPIQDDVEFKFIGIDDIRDDDEYGGYRVSLNSTFDTIKVPLKIDISTGDIITPKEILYQFDLMFVKRSIEVLAYNLETVIAEKFETILSRGILNTRARDFYDVYILIKLQDKNIQKEYFRKALAATAEKRGTIDKIQTASVIINEIKSDGAVNSIWKAYTRKFNYAKEIKFDDIIESLNELYKIYL
jgi:predicted nucleotidyltransferase component of viral defense system